MKRIGDFFEYIIGHALDIGLAILIIGGAIKYVFGL